MEKNAENLKKMIQSMGKTIEWFATAYNLENAQEVNASDLKTDNAKVRKNIDRPPKNKGIISNYWKFLTNTREFQQYHAVNLQFVEHDVLNKDLDKEIGNISEKLNSELEERQRQ